MQYDIDFLKKLFQQNIVKKYIKIILLDQKENYIQEITGIITDGSINVDGSSAVRRTCSISLILDEDSPFDSTLWLFKNRFIVFIGVENNVDKKFDDIIWFKQGVFVLTSISENNSQNRRILSLQGKDKGCLLNGEVAGTIVSNTNFDSTDIYSSEEEYETVKNPIDNIIKYAVHTFGNEPYENILINDLSYKSVELLQYRVKDIKMFVLQDTSTLKYQIVFEGIGDLGKYLSSSNPQEGDKIPNTNFVIIRIISEGDSPGYRPTDLIYVGDLISSPGNSVANAVLDPIVSQLGNFEYFYDINGRFIFQEKKNYLVTNWDNIENIGGIKFIKNDINPFYDFFTDNIIANYSASFLINEIKNDFVCWGVKKGLATDINISLRVSLDIPPHKYISYEGIEYKANDQVNYREILYQMALDHSLHENKDDFTLKIKIYDKNNNTIEPYHYVSYYPEILAFWREIYSEDNEWLINPDKNPEDLKYWLEFVDIDGEYDKYSIPTIGRRIKVENDEKARAINYREIPDIIFDIGSSMTYEERIEYNGYTIIQIPVNYADYFSISTQGKSCKDVVEQMMYSNILMQQTLNCQTLPIFLLEPNTIIQISSFDEEVNGVYMIKSFNYNFSSSGLMNLTLIKIIDSYY